MMAESFVSQTDYTRVVKALIGFPDAHRAANYGYYADCLTALVYTIIDFFSKYW